MRSEAADGRSMFYRAVDGLRLHLRDYRPDGAATTPVVCLAGLTRNADDFHVLAQALTQAPKPRRVLAFDYRGRGLSDYDPDPRRYTLSTEWADVTAGLRACGVEAAHFVGTSRGGLNIMAAAAEHRAMMRSVVLNDIGPVIDLAGLSRIKTYVGKPVHPRDLAQAVQILKLGTGLHFTGLSEAEWRLYATTTFGSDEANLHLRYDTALGDVLQGLDTSAPLPDLWRQFDALEGLPTLVIRGENSDLLSSETFEAMGRRWPGCETHLVPGQGHAPLLVDAASIERVTAFLAAVAD